jgi:NodT family efflux transporter outer membrane factor (OMF) lipoprotein
MISDQTKKSSVIKHIYFSFFVLYLSCAGRSEFDVETLEIPIPESWQTPFPEKKDFVGEWWLSFQDSALIDYLAKYESNSPDVKTILQNQKLARNNASISSSSIFPQLNLSARLDTNVQNLSGFGFATALLGDTNDSSGNGNTSQSSNNNQDIQSFGNKSAGINLNLQWEIDIWGRLINARKAAYKNYNSLLHDLAYLQFSTQVRATQLYYRGVESAAQFELSKNSYTSLVEIRDLVKDRYERGLRPSLDYRLAETSVALSILSMENNKNQLKSINRDLEILIGEYPKGVLVKNIVIPTLLPQIKKEIPASLIGRRPDIQSLLLQVESKNYSVAESKRNLLPGIFFNGNIGTSTQSLEDVLNEDYGIWNIGLNAAAPIFNGRKLRSLVKVQEAAFEVSKQNLIKGVLNAFSEVEQQLELGESLNLQIAALETALKQSEDAYNLSKERYDSGVTSLESVLNSQRQFNDIKSQHIRIQRLIVDNRLSLILALGGNTPKNKI